MHRTPEVGQVTGWGSREVGGVVVVVVVVMVIVHAPHSRPVHITTGPGLCCVPAAYLGARGEAEASTDILTILQLVRATALFLAALSLSFDLTGGSRSS